MKKRSRGPELTINFERKRRKVATRTEDEERRLKIKRRLDAIEEQRELRHINDYFDFTRKL